MAHTHMNAVQMYILFVQELRLDVFDIATPMKLNFQFVIWFISSWVLFPPNSTTQTEEFFGFNILIFHNRNRTEQNSMNLHDSWFSASHDILHSLVFTTIPIFVHSWYLRTVQTTRYSVLQSNFHILLGVETHVIITSVIYLILLSIKLSFSINYVPGVHRIPSIGFDATPRV